MKIHNIKLSFYFLDNLVTKEKSNRKVIDKLIGNVTTTIYTHTPFLVNCTGIRSREQINEIQSFLEEKYGVKCSHYQIDTTFMQTKSGIGLNLQKVYDLAKSRYHTLYRPSVQPELYSRLSLKAINKDYPTINLFTTGTVQFLGGKSFRCIQESQDIVRAIQSKCRLQ